MSEQKTRPIELRIGTVKVLLWRNVHQTDKGEIIRHKFQFQKLYRDKQADEWRVTDSFDREEIPIVRHLAHEAWLKSYESPQQDS